MQPYSFARRIEALLEKVDKSSGGCWNWLGDRTSDGYGCVTSWAGGTRKRWRAHRLVWEWFRGTPPGDLCVLHRCDNRACVNPAHLFIGTRADNQHDMVAKGRHARRGARGELNVFAKLTATSVLEIRRLRGAGVSPTRLAEEFGVSSDMVRRIVRRSSWRHI